MKKVENYCNSPMVLHFINTYFIYFLKLAVKCVIFSKFIDEKSEIWSENSS